MTTLIPLSSCATAIILEELIAAVNDCLSHVKLAGDSLHFPACYSQSTEGLPGGQRGMEMQGGGALTHGAWHRLKGRGMEQERAGY